MITDASFHPTDCNTLVYASSRGCIYMSDMRDQALCEGKATVFEDTSVQVRIPHAPASPPPVLGAMCDGVTLLAVEMTPTLPMRKRACST